MANEKNEKKLPTKRTAREITTAQGNLEETLEQLTAAARLRILREAGTRDEKQIPPDQLQELAEKLMRSCPADYVPKNVRELAAKIANEQLDLPNLTWKFFVEQAEALGCNPEECVRRADKSLGL